MSFLDSFLKRVVRSAVRQETNKIDNRVSSTIRENVGNMKKEKSRYEVPEKYMHFPQFDGFISDMSEKKETSYERCTLDYDKATDDEINKYIGEVITKGYNKMTNVRYEKGNEYIIIENTGHSLHLVFHVKK